jgi:hypothetical protein
MRRLTVTLGNRVGENVGFEEVLHVPLRRGLGLPRPENPTILQLVGLQLSLNEPGRVGLLSGVEAGHLAETFAVASVSVVDWLAVGVECSVVSRPAVTTIEELGTICDSRCKLSIDSPLVALSHLLAKVAGVVDVLIDGPGNGGRVEDFVVMSIEQEVVQVIAPIVPGTRTGKGVVEGDGQVGVLEVHYTLPVEFANLVHVKVVTERLVQQLDGGNSGMACKLVSEPVKGGVGHCERIALRPFEIASFARVIEAILRARCWKRRTWSVWEIFPTM